ncbi:ATP-binding cassette domain-containing protein [Pseudarthrobacter sp. NamE2]|uniref:ABC transporter ATP-binding protein n=1 Tax=Pseudarthrobacter sp. NamE2 TaxID=2576838 RepID=UPI0010FDAFA3|nr:ABC transporter ATP-binding protein [Pseudarthrobacter sp. NamE2]TLM86649.1 ATP-binding cassette domain-containing protein [Pseudarthrobacter sp. NamE2]
MAEQNRPALAAGIRHFAFHDGGAPVLGGVDVAFAPGTLTAILGTSGSGKSTLGRLLAGWLPPGVSGSLAGYLELAGTRLEFSGSGADPRIDPAQWGRHVGFVPQDPAAVLSTVKATVAEELVFGLENAGADRAAMQAAVEHMSGLLGLRELLERDPSRLSGGQLRRLAIGCAIITRPHVLVMDEPFASLDAAGAAELAALVRNLVQEGTAVVILSQAAEQPLLDADTWIVLADGTVRASGTPAELKAAGKVPDALCRGASQAAPGAGVSRVRVGAVPALELRDVSFGYQPEASRPGSGPFRRRQQSPASRDGRPDVLQNVNLAVHPGQIVALTGPNGAGKSTLLRHLNGLLRPGSGSVLVGGADISGVPVGVTAASVGVLFQHPRDQLFERTVQREVAFGLDRIFPRDEVGERAQAALAAVNLAAAAGEHPAELSASRQRLLALATVLARRPSVLALDEPTVALDGAGLQLLDSAVRSAAEEGAAVVLVTHDLVYARTAAHRILALEGGRLTER